MSLLNKIPAQFQVWWRRPTSPIERLGAFLLGAWAGLWLGVIGRLVLGAMPIPLEELFWFAAGTAIALAVLGLVFPKYVTCIAYPFSFLGITGST